MISVLIPVYNFAVEDLILQLIRQLNQAKVQFEILVLDDHSSKFSDQYQQFDELETVTVLKSEENLGRSKARNLLAKKARFEFLLFLDCDSLLVKDSFIKTYLNHAGANKVLIGGTRYKDDHAVAKRLHWLYGKKRESIDQSGFKSNNFLISKEDFSKIRFDESLVQYGHEDTLLGIHLKKNGVEIIHIDNPVYHCGLEDNEVFVKKSLLAVENAWKLYREGKIKAQDIRLLKIYRKWTNSFLGRVFLTFIRNNRKLWLNYSLAKEPRLFALDFLKICKLEELSRKEHSAE